MKKILLSCLCFLSILYSFSQYNFLDSSFATNGKFYRTAGTGAAMYSLATDTSGGIVAGGKHTSSGSTDWEWMIVKLRADGKADSSFSNDGMVTEHFSNVEDEISGVALQNDGKVIAVGPVNRWTGAGAVRYNTDGSRDAGFGTNGVVTILGTSSRNVIVAPDQKIYVACGVNGKTAILRMKPNGQFDSTFNSIGYRMLNTNTAQFSAKVMLQPDGKIIAYGTTGASGVIANDFGMVRLLPNGTVDSAFGTNGVVVTDWGTTGDLCNSGVLQADGKILLAGSLGWIPEYRIAAARYQSDGTLDSTFGNNGLVEVTDTLGNVDPIFGSDVLYRTDGKIYLVGYANYNSQGYTYLNRLYSDGSRDTTYANKGMVLAPTFFTVNEQHSALLSNNKIIFGSWGYPGGSVDQSFQIIRIKAEPSYTNTPTSIAEYSPQLASFVFPNPADAQLTIYLNGLQAEQVTIYHIDGKLVSETKKPVNNRLDISNLAKGVYIAEVRLGNDKWRVKWMKM
jgi:uncharacterized delta-60 repeat protein